MKIKTKTGLLLLEGKLEDRYVDPKGIYKLVNKKTGMVKYIISLNKKELAYERDNFLYIAFEEAVRNIEHKQNVREQILTDPDIIIEFDIDVDTEGKFNYYLMMGNRNKAAAQLVFEQDKDDAVFFSSWIYKIEKQVKEQSEAQNKLS